MAEIYYKKISRDWESADKRYHYRAGDEVMIIQENFPDRKGYYTVALDVGIVACIPVEYFEESEKIYKVNGVTFDKEFYESLEDMAMDYRNDNMLIDPYDAYLAGARAVIDMVTNA